MARSRDLRVGFQPIKRYVSPLGRMARGEGGLPLRTCGCYDAVASTLGKQTHNVLLAGHINLGAAGQVDAARLVLVNLEVGNGCWGGARRRKEARRKCLVGDLSAECFSAASSATSEWHS